MCKKKSSFFFCFQLPKVVPKKGGREVLITEF